MTNEDMPKETKVSDRGVVTIPTAVWRRLDIEFGDKLRWNIDDRELSVEIVRQHYGAFEDDDLQAHLGSADSDAHNVAGYEFDLSFGEES